MAIKANPVVEVLRTAVESGAGLEAASLEEVRWRLAAGCKPQHIVFDSPAKTRVEIEEIASNRCLLNANSFCELERIDACLNQMVPGDSAQIGLR